MGRKSMCGWGGELDKKLIQRVTSATIIATEVTMGLNCQLNISLFN